MFKKMILPLAAVFSLSLIPVANAACYINDKEVPCSELPGWFWIFTGAFPLVMLAIFLLMIVSSWKLFVKAGRPGWACLVPVYNMVIMLQIIGKPEWWVILMFIPFANFIVAIIVIHNLAKVFGKGTGYTLGLLFLPFIFWPILGFGEAKYQGKPPAAPAVLA